MGTIVALALAIGAARLGQHQYPDSPDAGAHLAIGVLLASPIAIVVGGMVGLWLHYRFCERRSSSEAVSTEYADEGR